jgi:hypothetical protein
VTCTRFEHYLLILRRRYTNDSWHISCVLCHLSSTNWHNTRAMYQVAPIIITIISIGCMYVCMCVCVCVCVWPTGGMDVCLLWVLWAVRKRSLRRADTRPEESYRLWRVVVRGLETSRPRRSKPALGRNAEKKKICVFVWGQFLFKTFAVYEIMSLHH